MQYLDSLQFPYYNNLPVGLDHFEEGYNFIYLVRSQI